MNSTNRTRLGWSEHQGRHLSRILRETDSPEEHFCARVIGVSRNICRVIGDDAEMAALVSGKLFHGADGRSDLPAVGDWVVLRRSGSSRDGTPVVRAVLERKTSISRRAPGAPTEEQIIAANVDEALIVTGLDDDYNLKRIERYLTLVLDFGVSPVVVLNKTDLCSDVAARLAEAESVSMGFPVVAVSAGSGEGVGELHALMRRGRTFVLLGSSGAGKSTILNRLAGRDFQRTRAVRENDSRGRHTTTARELFVLDSGALVIDNPGMREIQLWGDERGLAEAFGDVETLAAECRFKDCSHTHEPGCAVREAVETGALTADRLESYRKLQKELRYLRQKQSDRPDQIGKARWKSVSKEIRRFYSQRREGEKRG